MALFLEIRSHPRRVLKTIVLYLAFIVLGTTAGIVGPVLLDLQLMTSSTIEQVSYMLPARSAGAVISTFFVGLAYPHVNYHLLSFIIFLGIAAINVIIPLNRTFAGLIGTYFFSGMIICALDAGGNMHIIGLWGKEQEPFMQALHFFWGLGALIGPLIARPFLLCNEEEVWADGPVTNMTKYQPDDVLLIYPYSIIAGLAVFCSLIYLILWRFVGPSGDHPSRRSNETINDGEDINKTSSDVTCKVDDAKSFNFLKYLVIGLMMIFYLLYYGTELTFGSYVATFAVKSDLKLSKATGAYISSTLWLVFTFIRLLDIPIITRFGTEFTVTLHLSLIMLANGFIYLPEQFGLPLQEWHLWTGTIIIGIGISPLFACGFGTLEHYFPVSPRIMSILFMACSVGEFVIPVVISNQMEQRPRIFQDVTLICSVGMTLVYGIVLMLCRWKLAQHPLSAK